LWIFDTGMYEYDSSLAYGSLTTAQNFLDLGNKVHGLELKVDDIYKASDIADRTGGKTWFWIRCKRLDINE